MVNHRPTILRIAIFLLTFAAFSRLIACDFTWWDDQETIRQNPKLNPPRWKSLTYYWTTAGEHETMGLYVPVTYTVWSGLAMVAPLDAPDRDGFGLNPHVFHAANVIIHSSTAVIVFQLLLRLFGNEVIAALGALLFALHPVQVESVGWISGTKDLLCGLLSVSALLMYVRSMQLRFPSRETEVLVKTSPPRESKQFSQVLEYASRASDDPHKRGPSRFRYCLGILLFILAMLSKPTAVVVPLMAVVIGVFLLDRPIRQTIISLIPWMLLMIPCLIWTKVVQPATWTSPLPIWARPAVAADALAFYLCKLVWPVHLCIDYGRNPQAILENRFIFFSWIFPGAVAGILWWKSDRCRPAIAASGLFVLPLVPILGLVGFEFQMISTTSDHYMYMPMLGAAVLLCSVLTKIRSLQKIPVTIALLVLLAIRSVSQQPVWQDTRSLFLHALSINPKSVVSTDGLGFLTGFEARRTIDPAQARRLFDESIAWYQRSVDGAPNSVPSIYNLALDYRAIGREGIGRQLMHHIVEMQPALPKAMRVDPIDMARRLYDFPDVQGAIDWLDEVIREDPGNTQAAVLRERALEKLQRSKKN